MIQIAGGIILAVMFFAFLFQKFWFLGDLRLLSGLPLLRLYCST